jgi:hypothetical protein
MHKLLTALSLVLLAFTGPNPSMPFVDVPTGSPVYELQHNFKGMVVLDALSPEQVSWLTEDAKEILSGVRMVENPNWPRPASYSVKGNYVIYQPGASEEIILHEALHAYDHLSGLNPSSNMELNEIDRMMLYRRYWGRYPDPLPTANGNYPSEAERQYIEGLPPEEYFAAGGQLGPAGIPQSAAYNYRGFFLPLLQEGR